MSLSAALVPPLRPPPRAPLRRRAITAVAVVFAALWPRSAAARDTLEGSFSVFADHTFAMPSLSLSEDTETNLRYYSSDARIPLGRSATRAGFNASFTWAHGRHFAIPLISAGIAFGPWEPPVLSTLSGSFVELRQLFRIDIGILGLSVRHTVRRFFFAATLVPYVVAHSASISAFEGPTRVDLEGASGAYFAARVHLDACRRIDPEQRVCLSFIPSIFEGRWLNGVGMALKWEVAP